MQTEEAKKLFKKLKIKTLLDLALIIPSSYSDTTLSNSLEIGKIHTLEARVVDVQVAGGKLRVTFDLPGFGRKASSIFFRTTPYHHKLFAVGSTHYIQGRLEEYRGYLQIPQPRSIKQVGRVTPRYKTSIKEDEIRTLIEAYITEQNLYNEGLDSYEVAILLRIHFPKSIEEIYIDGAYKPEFIQALKFIEAYNHLKKLRSKRIEYPAMAALDGDISEFVLSLPFSLTDDQKKVIEEIRSDLAHTDKAAKRMIVGDVGSGKTIVILAAAMMALPHKSILMAPTSLLAIQLYEEAQKYLPSSVKMALVMQGKSDGDYKDADFIIGTHALLYLDDLPSAPLVMVDEQHRFGTRQRQMLEQLGIGSDELGVRSDKDNKASTLFVKPHYLQFSATPIPRTQAMMESELLDVSLIESMPFEKKITTEVIGRSDFANLLKHIQSTVERNEQVLIVYPLVEESSEIPYQSLDEARGFWEERFERVFVTHGKDKDKEEVLLKFREEGDILLATTVVEVGISLPRLTTVVIVGAERLGLATLHQLRGRVGRHGQESRCFLFTNNVQGSERLQKFAQTTNGFEIARLDLQYRDSGDILDGTIQSGQKFRWLDMAEDEEIIAQAKKRMVSP